MPHTVDDTTIKETTLKILKGDKIYTEVEVNALLDKQSQKTMRLIGCHLMDSTRTEDQHYYISALISSKELRYKEPNMT